MIALMEAETREFRYGPVPERYGEWRAMCARMGMGQTEVLNRLVLFALDMDPDTLPLIFGQQRPQEPIVELLLKGIRDRAGQPRTPRQPRNVDSGRDAIVDEPQPNPRRK